MFKIGAFTGRGFLSAIMAMAGSFASFNHIVGPNVPVAGSSFRKRGRNHKKMMKNPPNNTGWFQRHADLRPMPVTERMLLRHGWYRRQLRKQGIAIDAGAKNAVRL